MIINQQTINAIRTLQNADLMVKLLERFLKTKDNGKRE